MAMEKKTKFAAALALCLGAACAPCEAREDGPAARELRLEGVAIGMPFERALDAMGKQRARWRGAIQAQRPRLARELAAKG